MTILLTGSSGFLGSRYLQKSAFKDQVVPVSLQQTPVKNIDFKGITTVLHCAGIAHRMEKTDDKLYFDVNRDLTLELAEAAKAAGVKQFIFLSTIKVFGLDSSESLVQGNLSPSSSTDIVSRSHQAKVGPLPPSSFFLSPNTDAYGKSKLEAELGLKKLESEAFKIGIIRPPLIYGPGVKGNLLKLMQAIQGSGPLPLGGIDNRRSMIFVDNLIALIDCLIQKRDNITITPSDQPAISTSKLVQLLVNTVNPSKKILSIPGFMRPIIKVLKPAFHSRLFGSLEVAPHPELEELGYTQPYTVEQGLTIMAKDFLKQNFY
ncbi:MAG: NAD-dependent epimerase/dehydratase family protein [Cyclobacteriaceae bacterium]